MATIVSVESSESTFATQLRNATRGLRKMIVSVVGPQMKPTQVTEIIGALSTSAPQTDATPIPISVRQVIDLNDKSVRVTSPFNVIVKAIESDHYVANCNSPNISASGVDLEDAIANWKDTAFHRLTHYSTFPESQMSKGVIKTLADLRAHTT